MNIALILQHKLLLGIQRFLVGEPTPMPVLASPLRLRRQIRPEAQSRRDDTKRCEHATTTRQTGMKAMPLRVVRVLEAGQSGSSAGRLVISGRMADVCAELDRLVEREAALH